MADNNWQKVRELFDSALSRQPEERQKFVNEACGEDKILLAEVESLLSSHDSAESFMETPAVAEVAHMIEIEIKKLEAGKRFGYYEIINQIGMGGMGEVYRARDEKLNRDVAIKVLPASLSENQDRLNRFEQEAQAAGALNHPNILTIHEIGEVDGRRFIATEFIEGQTLRERLRSGVELDDALDIAIQVASALVAAHRVNIIHRDIKPENIMIRRDDGLVKVLDFGLAKMSVPQTLLDSEAETRVRANTAPGVLMGTVAYMSPEQARGDTVDARTDIWSLGAVLYELIAGCSPFLAATSNEIISGILSKTASSPLARYSRHVPDRLEEIVEKALSKNRDERYQTSKDLLIDLKRLKQSLQLKAGIERSTSAEANDGGQVKAVGRDSTIVSTGAAAAGPATFAKGKPISSGEYLLNLMKHSKLGAVVMLTSLVVIVVLGIYFIFFNHRSTLTEKDTILLADFLNTTGDATFDGSTLKQALAVQLRQTPFLNLFPEESVRETLRYMGRPIDEHITPQIGREICRRRGLKALLVGTIASLGRNYAITLEAINGQTGETIASQQIQAESKEQVLKALGQAALELRKQLGESLSTLQKYDAPIEQATTSSLEALNVYSKGLELHNGGDAKAALPLFNRAVQLDPNFAEAYLFLSWVYVNLGDLGKAGDFAAKAYSLRDRVTELEKLHIDEIYHLFTTGDFEKQKEADELIKRLYPNDSLAPASLGYSYLRIGQHEQALTEFREAIRANPNESHYYGNVSDILIRLNRFDEARETIKQARTRNLDHPGYRYALYMIGLAQGDDTEMQEQLEAIRKIDGEQQALTAEAGASVFSGRWRKAQELYHRAAPLSGTPSPSGTNAILPVEATIAGALFGFCQPATNDVRQALTISRLDSPVQILNVPVLADGSLCGDADEAQKLADEQLRRYPNATLLNVYSEPIMRAATALQRNRAQQAIEFLHAAIPYEGGNAAFWPNYLRGQAYLRLHRSNEAALEFQKIIDHRGWDPASPMYPLAHLGRARALSLAGDLTGSRKSYQDFFALWKDADSDLPVLIDARKQYEQLK